MKTVELTEEEQEQFVEYFYNVADGRLDDLDTPNPWGCPWYWDEEFELKGENIKEMAENYYKYYEDDIWGLIQIDNLIDRAKGE